MARPLHALQTADDDLTEDPKEVTLTVDRPLEIHIGSSSHDKLGAAGEDMLEDGAGNVEDVICSDSLSLTW